MTRFLHLSSIRRLALVAIVIGVAVALPAAHALSLHAAHSAHTAHNGPGVADRNCSLASCGAFALDGAWALLALASIVTLLSDPGSIFSFPILLSVDPPPRSVRA
jgi:hypothetical protein